MEKLRTCRKCGVSSKDEPFSKWREICKKCLAKYDHDHSQANKDQYRDQCRNYRAAHPEKVPIWNKKSYDKRRISILEKKKATRAANLEKYKERGRTSYKIHAEKFRSGKRHKYALNPDFFKTRVSNWRVSNADKVKQIRQKHYKANVYKFLDRNNQREAQRRGNGFERYSFADIIKRDRSICHICGKKVSRSDASRDHLIPISKGGPDTAANVALAHLICNIKRGAGRIPAQLRLIG